MTDTVRTSSPNYDQLTSDGSVVVSVKPLMMTDAVFLKVATNANATSVRVSYDPVSVEANRQTRELNKSMKLGFLPPAASTR